MSKKQNDSYRSKRTEADISVNDSSQLNRDAASNTDAELLELFKNGSNPNYAFNLIVKEYQERIYFHVRRMVVDHDDTNDVVQNTFIKAWKGLAKFRHDAKLYTWLYRIATNESITFLKKKKVGTMLSFQKHGSVLEEKLESSQDIDSDKLLLTLKKAILGLPERQQLVFNMRYYDELTYEEISQITGVTVGGLKASYHIAAKKIENLIKEG